ncbi:HAMP domain-containing histidine kinase [bacterium]|nr:HAMP domain-containing histidine kinase [bacterium]
MAIKKIFSQLDFFGQCRKYDIPISQCPQFLFLIMGLVIISSSIITYALGTRYIRDPEIALLLVLSITAVLLILAYLISRSFERLAQANRLKSEFISIVSHQLRSPLSNMRWALEILMSGKMGKIEEKQLEYFSILKENSDRMRELVKDLLTVSRIETARLSFKKEMFSLERLIKELISSFEPFSKASNTEISFQAEKDLPMILSDREKIKLVIENLIDNAIRYTKGKGKIEIKLKKKDGNLYFEIKDNGVGIPKGDQKYVFQKFFRSKNASRYQTEGSGLGLYIVKSILEKAKGKIGFRSQEGKGSTFWFILPIK